MQAQQMPHPHQVLTTLAVLLCKLVASPSDVPALPLRQLSDERTFADSQNMNTDSITTKELS